MRTASEIKNIRSLIASIVGSAAYHYTDDMVEDWVENLEAELSKTEPKVMWTMRIRTDDDREKQWKEIAPEPEPILASESCIAELSRQIMERDPKVLKISVVEEMNRTLNVRVHVYSREDCSQS